MIVTTAGRTNKEMIELAMKVAKDLKINYIHRQKQSINKIQQIFLEDVLVVGKERIEIHPLHEKEPLFFHPNSAMFRIKRILANESEPFIDVCRLTSGSSFLDCTLGLGADSIVASFITGRFGKVTSLEGNKYIYYLLKVGLPAWDRGNSMINEAMRRINVHYATFEDFLRTCESSSYDTVYFDPMFEETIEESNGIKGIKHYAVYSKLTEEIIEEAKRVAKNRVVIKDHWKSPNFERLGFTQIRRKTAKFHYGFIEV